MDSHEHGEAPGGRQKFAAVSGDTHASPEQGHQRRCPERDDDFGAELIEFGAEPPGAGLDLTGIRPRMQPALAALFEFEVFDGIGEIAFRPVDAGFVQALVQDAPGGSDERAPGKVLAAAGLFADEHDTGIDRALAEDQLRGVLVEVAALAPLRLPPQRGNRRCLGVFAGKGRAKFRRLFRHRSSRLSPVILAAMSNREAQGMFHCLPVSCHRAMATTIPGPANALPLTVSPPDVSLVKIG